MHLACNAGHIGVIRALLAHGANVEIANDTHERAIHLASLHGHNECVQMLIEAKANVQDDSIKI